MHARRTMPSHVTLTRMHWSTSRWRCVYDVRIAKVGKGTLHRFELAFLSKRCIEFHGSQQHHAHTRQRRIGWLSPCTRLTQNAHARALTHLPALTSAAYHAMPHVRWSICFGYHRARRVRVRVRVSGSARGGVYVYVYCLQARFSALTIHSVVLFQRERLQVTDTLCVPLCKYLYVRTLFSIRLNFQIFSFEMLPV